MTEFNLGINVNSRLGLNKVYEGGHWGRRKGLVDEIHNIVWLELARQKIPKKCCEVPVCIEILYNSRLDIDNHGFLSKAILDSLKGWLIVDDNRKYVRRLEQDFHSGDGVIVRIKNYENDEAWRTKARRVKKWRLSNGIF